MEELVKLLLGFSASVGVELTASYVAEMIAKVIKRKPYLKDKLNNPSSPEELELAIKETLGLVQALAADGEIVLDGAVIESIGLAVFDHQHGEIRIGNTTVSAPYLQTGGSTNSSGKTIISGGTTLNGGGSTVKVTGSASITLTGNAKIKQS